MNFENLDFHQMLLILLGMGTASVLMAMPIRLAQEVASTLWGGLIHKGKAKDDGATGVLSRLSMLEAKREERPLNGFHARLESIEEWQKRTQKMFDDGHFVLRRECDLEHDRLRREIRAND